ncbi:MAG TPA: hypothetical protein VHN14_21465 [Kofleriaceae bacterium]|jgi:hypothetical protein|nr:hypothetical protein [Kofleriaceae bacterium]
MSVQRIFALLLFSTVACSDSTDVSQFNYGGGQPGATLPEGGEIRHENVRFMGQPEQTWLMVYQYTAPKSEVSAPFAAPEMDGHGQFGNCVDERTGSPTWPVKPITGATYLELPKVELKGPGITGTLTIPKTTDPKNLVGNSTFRKYDLAYGGGAPGDTGPGGFNATLTKEQSTPGGDYTLDIGKKDISGNVTPMTYHIAEAYTAPLEIGKKNPIDPVIIPPHQDLTYTWTPPAQDFGPDGKTHTKNTHFNLTFFADPTNMANPSQFICFPDVDGHQTIPAAVIDALPPAGLIVNADITHYLEAREAAPGEMRRFDLVTIFCNISFYKKQ